MLHGIYSIERQRRNICFEGKSKYEYKVPPLSMCGEVSCSAVELALGLGRGKQILQSICGAQERQIQPLWEQTQAGCPSSNMAWQVLKTDGPRDSAADSAVTH